jgi:hypothetical protein
METFDLTPDPKILVALTHTPMQPLDALCELIDNAVDSFQAANLQGNPTKSPLVIVELPKPSEINLGTGIIRVRDNGIGMTGPQAERALRAGYSGNNQYDSLGLFGMGFNISTGKLGRRTRFLTAREEQPRAIEVTVDLEALANKAKSFTVPVSAVPKPDGFLKGTLIEIQDWWPEGNPNRGFVKKLAQYGVRKIREEIGRRYATILRDKHITIMIDNERCEPFEHCVWSDSRSVERRELGRIPAVFRFNELIGSQSRCVACTSLVNPGETKCQACGNSSLRTIEERIQGWIGIQRFDDQTEFGIDLIRNGRAIRIGEKVAFFEFTDEFKKVVKDYPIDSGYGRIVGEVHLNHVPVDFLKQDFQRSSAEWLRAMNYLRGESSLQPNAKGADRNKSPVYKLFQGYRRVRNFGTADMYMGKWDPIKNAAVRIPREIEAEFREKFRQRLPGFYDDAEWWKHVEQANFKPLEELVVCPDCMAQNLQGDDSCFSCGAVLIGKNCINENCKKRIAKSSCSCQFCGYSQIPEVIKPWNCQVCGRVNRPELTSCSECTAAQGTPHALSREHLLEHSSKSDQLSIPGCSIPLANGSHSTPIDVDTYVSRGALLPNPSAQPIPMFTLKTPDRLEIFLDLQHVLFKLLKVRPEQMIASEVALYIFDSNRRLSTREYEGIHAFSSLTSVVLQTRWQKTLEDSSELLRADISGFFALLREGLPAILAGNAENIYDDLDEQEQKNMVRNMQAQGVDLLHLPEMKASGRYLLFIDEVCIAKLFKGNPAAFFDGNLWNDAWLGVGGLPVAVIDDIHKEIKSIYLNCLEDVAGYLRNRQPDAIVMQRARASLSLLQQKIA